MSGRMKKRRHVDEHHNKSTKRQRQSEAECKSNEDYTDGEESNEDYSRQSEIDAKMETELDSKKSARMDGIGEVNEHIYDERNGRDMDEPIGGKSSSNKAANTVQMNLPSEAPMSSLKLRLPYEQTPVKSRQESNNVSPNIAYYGGSIRLRDFSTPAAPSNKASTSILNQSSPPSQPNFATQRMSGVDIASKGEEEDTKSSHGLMQSSQVWICLILVIRFVLAYLSIMQPIGEMIIERGMVKHRNWFGIPEVIEEVVERETVVIEKEFEIIVDNMNLEKREKDLLRNRKMIEKYRKEMQRINQTLTNFEAIEADEKIFGAETVKLKISGLRLTLKDEEKKLSDWNRTLAGAKLAFAAVLNYDGTSQVLTKALHTRAKVNFKRLIKQSFSNLSKSDLELFYASKFTQTIEKSTDDIRRNRNDAIKQLEKSSSKRIEENQFINLERLNRAQEIVFSEVEAHVDVLQNDLDISKFIDIRVKKNVQNVMDKTFLVEVPDKEEYVVESPTIATDISPTSVLSLGAIQVIIDGMIEIEQADLTDKHDFATIRSGSRVIRSGSRKTSLSISETMPLFNQMLSLLRLRFYGHRAESALNPTFPKIALGQCWSFEREGTRKNLWLLTEEDQKEAENTANDPDRGVYATLAVQLSSPTRVRSVVIEHPPKEISPSWETAIREFRLVGFVDSQARGSPWLLGSFIYNVDSDRSFQEFPVNTSDENGKPLPQLSSIVLSIDSNWGAEYSCLYRFRVHGD